jgi:hypothetical protein
MNFATFLCTYSGVSIRAWMTPFLVGIALLIQSSVEGQGRPAKDKRSPRQAEKQEAESPAPQPKLIARVYPVQDLLLIQADYPYRGGLSSEAAGGHAGLGRGGSGGGLGGGGMGGGGMFSISSAGSPPQVLRQVGGARFPDGGANADRTQHQTQAAQAAQLINVIKACVKGDWDEPAEVIFFHGNLVVRNTAEAHEELATLLRALRGNSAGAHSVIVEATWLLVSPQQLETLRQSSGDNHGSRSAVLRKNFEELSHQATAIHGRITCLNGQQVHLATGRRQVISTGGTPTVGVAATGYSPIVSVINLGAVLQVTPSISGDANAFVDLQSIVTQWKEPGAPIQVTSQVAAGSSEKQVGGPIVNTMLTIDRADVGTQEWSTTVSVPIGEPVYVGSVTLTSDKVSQLEAGQNPELALVIEVRPD